MIQSLDQLIDAVKDRPKMTVAVAAAESVTAVESAVLANEKGIATPMLMGDTDRIYAIAKERDLDLSGVEVVHARDDLQAADEAVRAVHDGRAQVVMKGHIHTDDYLRAVLNKDHGLRAGVIMSHCFVLDVKRENRLVIVTDAAMNIAPDMVQKAQIVLNAVYLADVLGMDNPRVGMLAAVEMVNPNMPATLDAAALSTMDRRGQFPTCRLDGPFALDNAISYEAAQVKGIDGDVAGRCDILVVPNIEAGNILAKSFSFLAGGSVAGVLLGAKAPVVLTSRADSTQSKLYSIALAVHMADMERVKRLKFGKVHF